MDLIHILLITYATIGIATVSVVFSQIEQIKSAAKNNAFWIIKLFILSLFAWPAVYISMVVNTKK